MARLTVVTHCVVLRKRYLLARRFAPGPGATARRCPGLALSPRGERYQPYLIHISRCFWKLQSESTDRSRKRQFREESTCKPVVAQILLRSNTPCRQPTAGRTLRTALPR
ncbi:hypothetical protein PT2222_270032 [Paraburkholderia tropica]